MGFLKSVGSFLSSAGGAAAMSGAVSLAGNLLNRHANKENNKLQVALQREQNQFNSDMWDKQSAFNAEQSQLQRDFTSQEREAQQAWQEKMIAEQNEYNSPAAQLQRMKQAGVNPNLFGGQMQSVSASPTGSPTGAGGAEAQASLASSGQVAHTNANVFDTSQLQNIIADTALKSAQADNLNAKTKTENVTRSGLVKLQNGQYDLLRSEINLNEETARNLVKQSEKIDADIQQIKVLVDKIVADTRVANLTADEIQKRLDTFDEEFAKRMREFDDKHALNIANIDEIVSQTRLNLQKIIESRSVVRNLDAQSVAQEYSNILENINVKFRLSHSDEFAEISLGELANGLASVKADAGGIELTQKEMDALNNNIVFFFHMVAKILGEVLGTAIQAKSLVKK